MLLWKELINESLESDYSQTASRDELTLLQIYLCRLFLSPAYQNKPCLLNSDEPFSFLGIKPASESGGQPGTAAFLRAIHKREKALTRSLKGKPELSFEPLVANLIKLLKPSAVEVKLLIYAILLLKHPQSKDVIDELELTEYSNAVSALARAMREPTRAIAAALDESASAVPL